MPTGSPTGDTEPTDQGEPFYQRAIQQRFGSNAAQQYAAAWLKYGSRIPARTKNGITYSGPYQLFIAAVLSLAAGEAVAGAAKGVASGIAGVGQQTANALPQPPSALTGVADFFSRLEDPHTWLRVGEFIAGAILLAIGANALTRGPARTEAQRTAKTVVRTAKKVVK